MKRAPRPELVWVVVSQHPRSASFLPFSASATRRGAWSRYVKEICGSEPRPPHLAKLFEILHAQRNRGDLSIQKAVLEVMR